MNIFPFTHGTLTLTGANSFFSVRALVSITILNTLVVNRTRRTTTIIFLFSVNRLFRDVTTSHTHTNVETLSSLIPGDTVLLSTRNKRHGIPTASLRIGSLILIHPKSEMSTSNSVIRNTSDLSSSPIAKRSIPITGAVNSGMFTKSVGVSNILRIHMRGATTSGAVSHVVSLMRRTRTSGTPATHFVRGFDHCCAPTIVTVTTLVVVIPPLAVNKS